MAIQMRRGALDKLDRSKLLPGEFAICEDGTVVICYATGKTKVVTSLELENARVSADGTVYKTLKERLDQEYNQLTKELENQGSSQNVNLTTAQINALDGMFGVCAYDDSKDISGAYAAFKTAFGISGSGGEEEPDEPVAPDEPDNPDATVYTITNNLTNCASNNSASSITEGSAYTATLTASGGYTLNGATISVVVNGVDVTDTAYSDCVITIQSVTGNVVITVVAVEESSGDSDEVVMLASITGDGASWIDTEFILEDNTHTMELSAKLADGSTDYFMGADGYNVGTSYGATLVWNSSSHYLAGRLNQGSFTNCGTWNTTDANSLVINRFWLVMADGSQKVYLDAEHTKQQSNVSDTAATYGTALEYVPIPLYLFHVNKTANANLQSTPSDFTIYFFKITDADGNVVLNLVPAKQGNKIGMYDTVAQKFHENKGTGTFNYEEVSA